MASLEAESRIRNAVVMDIKDISLEGVLIWPDGAGIIHGISPLTSETRTHVTDASPKQIVRTGGTLFKSEYGPL